ncbi:MAG: glycosyltransferase family 4 protein [Candidatus Rokubacteria bacterium]|nr:glycosyltransferase family 4 protein [Candidatus Rokubacteria bacterium]
MRFAFFTSTPLTPTEGSGTFVGIRELERALVELGHPVEIHPLRFRSGFHTLDRWLYNAGLALAAPTADLAVGFDLDGFLWARRRRIPFIASLKGIIADELLNERGLVRGLLSIQAGWERQNVARADRVVVTSRYCADVVMRAYGAPSRKISIVPELIDLADWEARFAQARRRPAEGPTVLCVARMYPRKRIEDLLAAAVILRHRLPYVQVRIVGSGPEHRRLLRLHGELGLSAAVHFLGEVSRTRLAEEYANADCFCLPSLQEGFGIVFLEAMAAGLPVVACRAAAVPEVVPDGVTGLLVEPRSPERLTGALEEILTDSARRKEYGEAARRRALEFSSPRVARQFLEAVRLP